MVRTWIALLPFLAACGSSPNTGPSPVPTPPQSSITLTGSITDTVSGAVIGQFSQAVNSLPARVTLSQAGYITRETWVHGDGARVDLFPDAGFDLAFYRQFARGGLDGAIQPLRVLQAAPAIYLQTTGLSAANVAALEQAARATLPALTGGRFQVTTWETGDGVKPDQAGWVSVELIADPDASCGRATVGTTRGHIWMNIGRRQCDPRPLHETFAHELGHTLGFWHVSDPAALMHNPSAVGVSQPSALERHHAALAYSRQAGNTDIDSDPLTPSTFQTRVVID